MSSLPIIFFAFCHVSTDPSSPRLIVGSEDFEALWAAAAVVNSVFAYCWDIIMDWGFFPDLKCQTLRFGLRPILLYRKAWALYYIVIICNLLGRMCWSLRWSKEAHFLLGGFFLTSTQQAAEVCRRCLWNILRVEWECINTGVGLSDTEDRK